MHIERILEAHDAEADGAVSDIGLSGLGHAVIVDVDDVIEHAHGGFAGLAKLFEIELAIFEVVDQVDGAEVADSGFGV